MDSSPSPTSIQAGGGVNNPAVQCSPRRANVEAGRPHYLLSETSSVPTHPPGTAVGAAAAVILAVVHVGNGVAAGRGVAGGGGGWLEGEVWQCSMRNSKNRRANQN
jgi:hypothetical protein